MKPILEIKNGTKAFHGAVANSSINFCLYPGEIHSLLGENGAGKSTLTKIIAGVYPLTEGKLVVDDVEVNFKSPKEALEAGIAMVYQENSLVPSMTVAQNIYLGEEKAFNGLSKLKIAAQQFLQSLNFPVDPGRNVAELGAAQCQMVEIARAVHHNAPYHHIRRTYSNTNTGRKTPLFWIGETDQGTRCFYHLYFPCT